MPAADDPVSDVEADALLSSLADETSVVLAVSGGPDSTALLLLASRWRRRHKRGPKLFAVTVDHGLRAASRAEAAAVKRLARRLGVAHRTMHWRGRKPSSGLQEKARTERYRLLAEAARRVKARCVLTAHTLDDQAETVLIRMARGSGLTGLAAMAPVTPMAGVFLVRPFLDIAKARLVETLRAAKVAYADDPSNRDPRFTRARVRGLLPTLAPEGLSAGRLATLARRLRRAEAAIEAMVDEAMRRLAPGPWLEHGPISVEQKAVRTLPEEIALRLIGRMLAWVGDEGPVELAKLESLSGALRTAMAAESPVPRFRRTLAGAVLTLIPGRLTVERAPPRRHRPIARRGRGRTKKPDLPRGS